MTADAEVEWYVVGAVTYYITDKSAEISGHRNDPYPDEQSKFAKTIVTKREPCMLASEPYVVLQNQSLLTTVSDLQKLQVRNRVRRSND